ncbi:MAG: tetratricopeptide repeat protein [Planctomycetes bacterium]|nr:tetratricopeptide repeat protein [Planctomycetota bacterium]
MDYAKHIQKAEEAARRKNYDFAVELYQQLLELDADQGDARAGLRRVLKLRHEAKKGSRLLRALSGAGPLAVAKTMRKAGRLDAAIKSAEQYLASNPLDVDANLFLGEALEAGEYYKSACAVYEFIAEIAPKNPEGLKRAGAMMYQLGEHEKALDYYERALEADPRDQDALKQRKNLAAETALTKRRDDQVAHSREQIKDKDTARELERATRLHKSDDELREDLERLEARYAESPSDADLMVAMADVLEKLKEHEAALDLVERACDYRKDSPELAARRRKLREKVLKRGIAKADRLGDTEKANRLEQELLAFQLEALREEVRLRPGDAALRLELGRGLARTGELDAAVAEFQRAVDDPRVGLDALCQLGGAFQQKGFLDLAKKNYERALSGSSGTDARSKEILYNLGSIAEAEGQPDEARARFARIFEIDIGYKDVAEKMEHYK